MEHELIIELPAGFDPRRHRDRVADLVAERAPGHRLTRIEGRIAFYAPVTPGRAVGRLVPDAKAADLPALGAAVERRGYHLVGADIPRGTVTLAQLSDEHDGVRDRISARLGCHPWEVQCAVGTRGTGRVTDVVVTRWPAGGVATDKASTLWLEIARAVVGDRGWTRRMTARGIEMHAEPVPDWAGRDAPWEVIASAPWHRVFLGYDGRGRMIWGDLLATPHGMVVGKTGSGKSVSLQLLLTGLLLRGWDLRICEPVKGGLDFSHLRPFCTRWAATRTETAAALTELSGEIDRRKALLGRHSVPRWDQLPEPVREAEDVRPILVMLDELESALQEISEKEDPEAAEAVATSRQLVGRFLREARYVGIHVVLATQRWTVEALGKESSGWRANAGLRWVLGRMNLDTLKVSTVESDACQVAYERAWGASLEEELDEPDPVQGLGIAELDYRDPCAVRAPWPGTGEEQAVLLRARQVAEPGGPAPDLGGPMGPPAGWDTRSKPVDEVEMELSWDEIMGGEK